MWSCCRERQKVTMALLSYMSFWPDIFHSLGSIGGWSCSELIGGESSGGIMGGCRYAANSASVSSPWTIGGWKNIGESSLLGSMGGCTYCGDWSGGSIGGCHEPPRSMLNDEYGVKGKSTEERCECEVDDDAEVNESAYEANETADDGGSDADPLLIRRRFAERP